MRAIARAVIAHLLLLAPLVAGTMAAVDSFLPGAPLALRIVIVLVPVSCAHLFSHVVMRRELARIHGLMTGTEGSTRPGRLQRFLFPDYLAGISRRYEEAVVARQSLVRDLESKSATLDHENRIRDAMLAISQSVMAIEDLTTLLDLILDKAIEANNKAQMGSLMLLGNDDMLSFAAVRGYDYEQMSTIRVPLRDSFLFVASGGKIKRPMVINNIAEFNKKNFTPEMCVSFEKAHARNIGSTLCAPVIIEGSLYGMLSLDNRMPNAFAEEDITILDYFTTQAGIALKNHELLQKTIYLSRYDGPTNTLNRSFFEQFVGNRCRQDAAEARFSLVIFDLNNLKQVNDHHGHQAGDRLIATFAEAIRDGLTECELLARYGGDEFIAILESGERDEVLARIEAMRASFNNRPIRVGDSSINGSFSYGVAIWPDDSRDYESLIRLADRNMYCYKSALKKTRGA